MAPLGEGWVLVLVELYVILKIIFKIKSRSQFSSSLTFPCSQAEHTFLVFNSHSQTSPILNQTTRDSYIYRLHLG